MLGWNRSAWVMAYVIIRIQSSLNSSSSHQRAIKHIWWSDSLTYGSTLSLPWLMCSLAPISQPQALPINPDWLLIGAEGDTWGLSQAVYQNLPSSSRLICSHVSALWLVRWNPLGWKALVASSQIYQDHPRSHEETCTYSKHLSIGISEKCSCYTHNCSPGVFRVHKHHNCVLFINLESFLTSLQSFNYESTDTESQCNFIIWCQMLQTVAVWPVQWIKKNYAMSVFGLCNCLWSSSFRCLYEININKNAATLTT